MKAKATMNILMDQEHAMFVAECGMDATTFSFLKKYKTRIEHPGGFSNKGIALLFSFRVNNDVSFAIDKTSEKDDVDTSNIV